MTVTGLASLCIREPAEWIVARFRPHKREKGRDLSHPLHVFYDLHGTLKLVVVPIIPPLSEDFLDVAFRFCWCVIYPIVAVLFNGLVQVSAAPIIRRKCFNIIAVVFGRESRKHFTGRVRRLDWVVRVNTVTFGRARHELKHTGSTGLITCVRVEAAFCACNCG